MGYYSDFTIQAPNKDLLAAIIVESGYDDDYWSYYDDETIFIQDAKWYEHDDQLKAITARKEFEDVKVYLEAVGEDGDRWCVYALNGEIQQEEAIISYPDCKLKYKDKNMIDMKDYAS